jgi:hypothetical protein
MKTYPMKSTLVLTIAVMLLALPSAWGQMGGGGGMMGGGGGMMRQIVIADLDGDKVPEIVTIAYGTFLVIMDNEGNVKSSKPLPLIPGQIFQRGSTGSLDVSDLDGDGIPEIVTIYSGVSNFNGNFFGKNSGAYLVILDNQGNLKSYKPLPYTYY